MLPMSARRLAAACQGEILSVGSQPEFSRLSTDTRSLKKGDVYVALKGANFDGERFFEKALRAGAAALIGRRPPRARGAAAIRVDEGLRALQDLAADQRRCFSGTVAAITGSNGKTGVKECLAHLLGADVLATPGNWNNQVGLPLTLLSLEPRHQAAVLELGMNHYGELRLLGSICRPDIAIELNVGDAHIEFFKSRQGVARAKEELLQSMGSGGIAVLNGDDPLVRDMGKRFKGRKIFFGTGKASDLRMESIEDRGAQGLKARFRFEGRTQALQLPMGGRTRIYQALAAVAAGLAAGRSLKSLAGRLGSFKPLSKGRQQIESYGGASFILDTYNASPQSMQAGLELLALSAPRGRRLAFLGDMLELGNQAAGFHRELGRMARRAGLRALGALGPNARHVLDGFGGPGAAFKKSDAAQAAQWLQNNLRAGDWVLLKGSRGMAVERVFTELKQKG